MKVLKTLLTELALRLEHDIRARAKENQKIGGTMRAEITNRGSIILSKAEKLQKFDNCHELAKIARVSEGTIAKVKTINNNATEEQQKTYFLT